MVAVPLAEVADGLAGMVELQNGHDPTGLLDVPVPVLRKHLLDFFQGVFLLTGKQALRRLEAAPLHFDGISGVASGSTERVYENLAQSHFTGKPCT